MAQFDYQAYIKNTQERTIHSQIDCTEWRGDNYIQYTLKLPNDITIVFILNDDNTREFYYFDDKEVALIEHQPGCFHVVDQNEMRIKIFGTHLNYDSDDDPKEEGDGTDLYRNHQQRTTKSLHHSENRVRWLYPRKLSISCCNT